MSGDPQERITACWATASGSYDAQPGHGITREGERDAWQAMLRTVLPPAPADVLDVGTGTGFMAIRAHELGHRVTAVDLSDDMLAVARRAAAAMDGAPSFSVGDAIAPAFPSGSFDAVMNRHLLWTLTDPAMALRNWHALLRPGGVLVVIDGIWSHDDDDAKDAAPDEHEQEEESHAGEDFYTPEVLARLPLTQATSVDEVVRVIEEAGFGEVRAIDLSGIDDAEGHLESVRGRYGLRAVRA
jgi:SAM-dependent methyltransferase